MPCEEKEKGPKEEQKEQKLEQKEKEEEKDDEDYDDNSFDDNMSVPESIQEESDLGSDTRRTEDSVWKLVIRIPTEKILVGQIHSCREFNVLRTVNQSNHGMWILLAQSALRAEKRDISGTRRNTYHV